MLHHTSDALCPLCEEKLTLAHPLLTEWYRTVKTKFPEVHVAWSFRDREAQEAAYEDGKTKLHFPYSAHNEEPAAALDLFQIIKEQAIWDRKFLYEIHKLNQNDFPNIVWGGLWKTLGDFDHFELMMTD